MKSELPAVIVFSILVGLLVLSRWNAYRHKKHKENLARKKATRGRRAKWYHARAIGKARRRHKMGDYNLPPWRT